VRETLFQGILLNEAPLRIGAGTEPVLGSSADLAVLRIPYNGVDFPYVPGSSLKGAFRGLATLLVRQKGLSTCTGFAGDTCMDKLSEQIHDLWRKKREEEAVKLFNSRACLLCKIFGSLMYRGLVSFSDAYPWDEKGNPYSFKLGSRVGVRIGRETGSVVPGGFFASEYIEPGARFRFLIKSTNLPTYALGLLSKCLLFLNEGEIKIGGFKTKGFGKVKVEQLQFRTRDLPQEGVKMRALDDKDLEVGLPLVKEEALLVAREREAWEILKRLAEVWDRASLSD